MRQTDDEVRCPKNCRKILIENGQGKLDTVRHVIRDILAETGSLRSWNPPRILEITGLVVKLFFTTANLATTEENKTAVVREASDLIKHQIEGHGPNPEQKKALYCALPLSKDVTALAPVYLNRDQHEPPADGSLGLVLVFTKPG